jgi:crotonobetainyl-CoA:carnitine CoA-transferase CaiB-like acyl-CoA transferase
MLDLESEPGRRRFDELLAEADVLVVGLRSDAPERLDYPAAVLSARNPRLVLARVDAYGYAGPWRDRRGSTASSR